MATERGQPLRWTIRQHSLTERQFVDRHTAVVSILGAHLPLLVVAAVASGWAPVVTAVWIGGIGALALAALDGRRSQLHRSLVATLGLLACSAMVVQVVDGPVESGFHVFVVVAVVAWYESPAPFAVTLAWPLLHHGVVGAIAPTTLYDDLSQTDRPWAWAALRALQVGPAIIAAVTAWQFSQNRSRRSSRLLAATHADGRHVAVELSSHALPGPEEQSAVTIRDVTARRRSEAELRRLALEDPLTGLANRARLMDRLEAALARSRRHHRAVAVVLLDLDHFKDVNDTFGHETGDQLLCEVAGRLVEEVRDLDTVARLGGDEFVIVLDDMDQTAAVEVVERVRRSLCQPYGVALGAPAIGVSIGVRMIGDGGIGAEQAVADADVAMYRSKRSGRGRVTVFDAELGATTRRDVRLGAELEEAIDGGQLRLLFQPMFDERTLVMRGAEALVRWQHPTEGLLPPAAFIPQAEKMRLIGRLGSWVLEEVWTRLVEWQQYDGGLSVSINVSRSQFKDREIVRHVHRLLVEQPMDPRLLWLEITESNVADTTPLHDEVLCELRSLGIRLVVDDFGTGQSSLAAISDLAVDAVKVDRRFVAGVDRDGRKERLLDAVLAMAGALGLRTVTEGIETVGELEVVRRSGPAGPTRYAQGYLLARPVPASVITERLRAGVEGRRADVADVAGQLIQPGP